MDSIGLISMNSGEFLAQITNFENQTVSGRYISGDYESPETYPEFSYDFGYAICKDISLDTIINDLKLEELYFDYTVDTYIELRVESVVENDEGVLIKFSY